MCGRLLLRGPATRTRRSSPLPLFLLVAATLVFRSPTANAAVGGVLSGATTWSGVVEVAEDVLVPAGAQLTVLAGTRVVFLPADSTKTDPVFWNPETELAVQGSLRVLGSPEEPVRFEGRGGPWGGIVAGPGASVEIRGTRVHGAAEGLLVQGAAPVVRDTLFEECEYGLVLGPGADLEAAGVEVVGARVGVVDGRDAPVAVAGVAVRSAADADRLVLPGERRAVARVPWATEGTPRIEFLGEYTVAADETWSGEVVVAGRITVVPGAVLTLAPGTRVAFRKLDSNGDGLGEGELLVLGGIRSLGAAGRPVEFTSAEGEPAAGDWDKVSLIASEDPGNVFRHTVFLHGTQALHAHFSRFLAADCYFEDNLRAVQFQESDSATVARCVFVANKQALRFRDSRVEVTDSVLLGNLYAVHVFRCDLEFRGNTIEGSALGGVLAKESRVSFTGNRLLRNRDGVRMRDEGAWALLRDNRIADCAENAVSLSEVSGEVSGNLLEAAGLDLLGVDRVGAVVRGNVFGTAGRDAVHLSGPLGLDARGNAWGFQQPGQRIHDAEDEPGLGLVGWVPPLSQTPLLTVPPRPW